MSGGAADLERRLLILAPVGKDAALMASMLRQESLAGETCRDLPHVAAELERGAAAVLITEEALLPGDEPLARFVAAQEPWSDLPILLLTRQGADSREVAAALAHLGNVTLLERPLSTSALASAARSACRARERQYQMRASLREREEADRRKDEFLATLAHELRNPLAPIRNSVTLLALNGREAPPEGLCERMARQVDVMVRLVDDLMEVSRITRGKIILKKQAVRLGAVLDSALETALPLIEAAELRLERSFEAADVVLDADPVRLAQVFANLLNNAARYTPPGGRVSVTTGREGDAATVTVADTGIGIEPAALPHIFDMFVQAAPADGRSPGLGIGLTLARSLVELHGGAISAESAGAGAGSRFVVRLPVRPALAPGRAPAGRRRPPEKLPRTLIVDDNRDAADTLCALLQLMGAEVKVAYGGDAALRLLDTFRPGLVLLDLGMPEMDGYQVARAMREREAEVGRMRIVALTGWGQDRDREQTRAAGFDHHLVKPVELAAIQELIRRPADARG